MRISILELCHAESKKIARGLCRRNEEIEMTEIRRFFVQFKKRVLSTKSNSDGDKETKMTEKIGSQSLKTERQERNSQMRRTPDLLRSHSQMELPPIPPNQNSSCHGIIRGYPAVAGHIYEEIASDDLDNDDSFNTNSDCSERTRENGRGGVFYISPIDGALHRLRAEKGNRIICPHLRFDTGSLSPRQVSFTRTLFGKQLSVCKDCAISLRERFVSGEPDVIYPTYWRSLDFGNVNIPCPNLPENLTHDSENPQSNPDDRDNRRERRHSVSSTSNRITLQQPDKRTFEVADNTVSRRRNIKMTASADEVDTIDKLSCRATKFRLPEIEARLLGYRSTGTRHRTIHAEQQNMATHKSMNNLLLSDVLRRNHDRQCLVW